MARNRQGGPQYKKDNRMAWLVAFCVVLGALVLLMPKSPVVVAVNAGASDDGGTAGTGGYKGLRITEVMSDNASALPDEEGRFSDFLELTNTTENAINLKNVGLSNRSELHQLSFS